MNEKTTSDVCHHVDFSGPVMRGIYLQLHEEKSDHSRQLIEGLFLDPSSQLELLPPLILSRPILKPA